MSNKSVSLPQLLQRTNLVAAGRLTVVRDATEALDSASLVLNMAKAAASLRSNPASNPSAGILYVSTRSRTHFDQTGDNHAYPARTRAASATLAVCTALDPHTMQTPDFGISDADFQMQLTNTVIDAAHQNDATLVVVECLHSLKFTFGVNPSSFVRSVLGPEGKLSVLVACPTACGLDDDIANLSDIADTVIDLRDLQTGVATDVDGLIRVAKEKGRWRPNTQSKRYKVTEASFYIYV